MDEQKQAQEFNALLDSILAGSSITLDSSELSDDAKLAGYLHGLDLAANTFALQRDIRERLTIQNKEKILMKRKKLLIGVTLLVTIGLFVLSPAGTYAQSILRRIGGITFTTQEPFPKEEQDAAATIMAERIVSATAKTQAASTSNPGEASTASEATIYPTATPLLILSDKEIQNRAGFFGWQPKFVPGGYILHGKAVVHDNFGNPIVRTRYWRENNHPFGFYDIDQRVTVANQKEPIGNWNIGDVPVSNVTVNGEVAVFAEKAHIIPPPGANILVWTADEYTFTMIASDLSQEAMVAVAESMQAP
jgi:hypothetical protein